jgi:hypothetical protein
LAIESAVAELRKQLAESPLDEQLQNEVLLMSEGYPALLESAYELALQILRDHPDSVVARAFALKAGRASYSAMRPNNSPTMYDEQAIQNDIMVRTSTTPPQQQLEPASVVVQETDSGLRPVEA